jgi:hypothetical protein
LPGFSLIEKRVNRSLANLHTFICNKSAAKLNLAVAAFGWAAITPRSTVSAASISPVSRKNAPDSPPPQHSRGRPATPLSAVSGISMVAFGMEVSRKASARDRCCIESP